MSTKKKPAYHAFSVREREKGKPAVWTRIGAVWPHGEGKEGMSLDLEAIPINFDGRIVLMPPKDGAAGDAEPRM